MIARIKYLFPWWLSHWYCRQRNSSYSICPHISTNRFYICITKTTTTTNNNNNNKISPLLKKKKKKKFNDTLNQQYCLMNNIKFLLIRTRLMLGILQISLISLYKLTCQSLNIDKKKKVIKKLIYYVVNIL